ncbi:MAG: ATP-binding protein [Proteobacteria bacterium]|nr:ATP-binding protein [Pseudomonadota bacterium]
MLSNYIHKNVITDTSHSIIYTNKLLEIVFVNDGWVNQTGYSKNESLGKTPEQLLAGPDTEQKKLSTIYSAIRENKRIQIEIINYKKNGHKYVAFLDIAPIQIDGKAFGWMCVSIDITKYKNGLKICKKKNDKLNIQFEELLNIYQKRENEIAGLSHDLRNVIHQISASYELIALEKLTGQQRNIHDKASNVIDTAVILLDEIIRLNQINYHSDINRFKKVNLYNMIKNCLSRALISQSKENCQITYHFSNMDATVISDSVLLMRIFSNIISNAVKYKKDKICISVFLHEYKSHYRINIKDAGIGIEENVLKNIFAQYERGENFLTNRIKGHGLGMSIVKSLCDELKIKLSVNSVPHKGTNVSLNIPKKIGSSTKTVELSI